MKRIIKVKYDTGDNWYSTPLTIRDALESGLELLIIYKEGKRNKENLCFASDLSGESVKVGDSIIKLE